MPRAKSLQHFPDSYQEMLQSVGVEGKVLRTKMLTIHAARSLRGHWYSFIGSIKAAHGKVEQKEMNGVALTPTDTDIKRLQGLAATVMVGIEETEAGIFVIYQSRENSWQAQALRNAEVSQGVTKPSGGGVDEAAQRLLEVQRRLTQGDKP